MSRSLNAALRYAMMQEDAAGVIPLVLLEITHPTLSDPIRLVNDTVSELGLTDIVHGGQLYAAYPFDIILPGEDDEAPVSARLSVDNIDRSVVGIARLPNPAPEVIIKIINKAQPDDTPAIFGPFVFDAPTYTEFTVETDLIIKTDTLDAYPWPKYGPDNCPALYRQLS